MDYSQNFIVSMFLLCKSLEKDGIKSSQAPYLQRQQERINDILQLMEEKDHAVAYEGPHPFSDGELRLGCFLSWGLFRQRFNLDKYPRLEAFVDKLNDYPYFADTDPSKA